MHYRDAVAAQVDRRGMARLHFRHRLQLLADEGLEDAVALAVQDA